MNFTEAIDRACQEPTLLDALAFISVWETERAIKEAHEFLSGRKERGPDGTGWSTCHRFLLNQVMMRYQSPSQTTLSWPPLDRP